MESRPGNPIPRGRVGRVAPLVGLAGRTTGEAVVASMRKNRGSRDSRAVHERNAERYAQRLGNSRGVLMKAGQILSMVIPEAAVDGEDHRGIYQRAFAKLFDDAPPMPTRVAVATLEAELGKPITELFASFEPKPLASASIGQVHRATLHDGTAVVVKVQYPGVEEAIRADLKNTQLLGTFLQLILTMAPGFSRMDVRAIALEISERIGEEIDYLTEAANQRRIADLYRGHPSIRIPEVYEEFTTRRVLAMAYDDGMRYGEAIRADQELRDRWGEAIYRFVLDGLIRVRISNGDAHPGNFLFHADGSVTCLDFGCVKRLSPEQSAKVAGQFGHILSGDAVAFHNWTLEFGYLDRGAGVDPIQLRDMFNHSFSYLTATQPYTFPPDAVSAIWRITLNGKNQQIMRKFSSPADDVTIMRSGTGVLSLLGGLQASARWRSICEEYCAGGPVSTDLGRLCAEFWAASI